MKYIVDSQISSKALLRVDGTTSVMEYSTDGNNWASVKIGDPYIAGVGISIDGTTISVNDTVFQRKLTAGSGIALSNNTITCDLNVVQKKLTAGTGIRIANDGTISVTTSSTYSAGWGIDITNNIISIDADTMPSISGSYDYEIPFNPSYVRPDVSEGVRQYISYYGDISFSMPWLNEDEPDLYVKLVDCEQYNTKVDGVDLGHLPDLSVIHFYWDGQNTDYELRLAMPDYRNQGELWNDLGEVHGSVYVDPDNGKYQRMTPVNTIYLYCQYGHTRQFPIVTEIYNPDECYIVINGSTVTNAPGVHRVTFYQSNVSGNDRVYHSPLVTLTEAY